MPQNRRVFTGSSGCGTGGGCAGGHNHVNGIENFWNQAKRHTRKSNGIDRESSNLFPEECEWGFGTGGPGELPRDLKSLLKELY